jgi:hypothetical protein
VAGAHVVLVGGEAVLYLGKGGKQLLTFPAADDDRTLSLAARALEPLARARRGKALRLEKIDGEPAQQSDLAPRLRAVNFTSSYRRLELEAR